MLMLIYEVTAKVKPEIADEFVEWMTLKHVPDVVNTGCFQYAQFCRMDQESAGNESSFIIQYDCLNRQMLEDYFKNYAPALRKEFNDKFDEKCELSRTIMEVIKEIRPHS